jgi:hypothetical protein
MHRGLRRDRHGQAKLSKSSKTFHAKAQRRKGNKAIVLCDLCALVRQLTDELFCSSVNFFTLSDARATSGAKFNLASHFFTPRFDPPQ